MRASRLVVALTGVAMMLGTLVAAHGSDEVHAAAPAEPADLRLIEQGRYLSRLGNCMGCHTAAGGEAYAGGRAIPTPYGTFFGPNLTPSVQHGIGDWTADDFWRALHHGESKSGDALYPAFPYSSYTRVSREDSDALFTYFQSLAPVEQANREHDLAFPYDQRWLVRLWRTLYFRPGALEPVEGQSDQWLRGRYLVEGLAHCAECHTLRDRWGALKEDANLAGAPVFGQGWFAPPLTGDTNTGLGRWSAREIADYLKTGVSAHSFAAGPMAESIFLGFQYVSDDDALAMAEYLKSLEPSGADAVAARDVAVATGVMRSGSDIYTQHCVQCHKEKGEGESPAWPPLAQNPSVVAASPVNAVRIVLAGGFSPATEGNPQPHGMPPFGHVLNDAEIAAVVSYIRTSWGNRASAVSLAEARRIRSNLR